MVYSARRVDLGVADPVDRRMHQRNRHAKVDPVKEPVREHRGGREELDIEVGAHLQHVVLEILVTDGAIVVGIAVCEIENSPLSGVVRMVVNW